MDVPKRCKPPSGMAARFLGGGREWRGISQAKPWHVRQIVLISGAG